jgi:hypothetical protein
VPDTSREILEQKNTDALAASHERCIAASVSRAHSDAHVDETLKAITRSRALLLRVEERLG